MDKKKNKSYEHELIGRKGTPRVKIVEIYNGIRLIDRIVHVGRKEIKHMDSIANDKLFSKKLYDAGILPEYIPQIAKNVGAYLFSPFYSTRTVARGEGRDI